MDASIPKQTNEQANEQMEEEEERPSLLCIG